MNDVRKFRNQQDKLRQQAHMKRFLEKKNKRVKKTTPPVEVVELVDLENLVP